jgi:hypothetical protein
MTQLSMLLLLAIVCLAISAPVVCTGRSNALEILDEPSIEEERVFEETDCDPDHT